MQFLLPRTNRDRLKFVLFWASLFGGAALIGLLFGLEPAATQEPDVCAGQEFGTPCSPLDKPWAQGACNASEVCVEVGCRIGDRCGTVMRGCPGTPRPRYIRAENGECLCGALNPPIFPLCVQQAWSESQQEMFEAAAVESLESKDLYHPEYFETTQGLQAHESAKFRGCNPNPTRAQLEAAGLVEPLQ